MWCVRMRARHGRGLPKARLTSGLSRSHHGVRPPPQVSLPEPTTVSRPPADVLRAIRSPLLSMLAEVLADDVSPEQLRVVLQSMTRSTDTAHAAELFATVYPHETRSARTRRGPRGKRVGWLGGSHADVRGRGRTASPRPASSAA